MAVDVELLYAQHLSEADRRLLRSAGGGQGLVQALVHPAVQAAVFGAGQAGGELVATTPFLTFAAAVHRTAVDLDKATFVEERWSSRERIPVFDVARLRDLLAQPMRRLFLVELLASYTHVASGATWERTRRGWRRRRFSELDPVRLAGLLEVVAPEERPGVYRRLGDLALFLTGVFPDHPSIFDIGGGAAARLLRLSGARHNGDADIPGRDLMAQLGARWYRLTVVSARTAGSPVTDALAVIGDLSERFDDARRVLNVVTDKYLFPVRDRWFGVG